MPLLKMRDRDSIVAWYVLLVVSQAALAPLVLVGTAGAAIWAQAYIYICGSSAVIAFWAWVVRRAGLRARALVRQAVWLGGGLGLGIGGFFSTGGAAFTGFEPSSISYIAYFGSAGTAAGLALGFVAGLAARTAVATVRRSSS